jgi:hypothetical protein
MPGDDSSSKIRKTGFLEVPLNLIGIQTPFTPFVQPKLPLAAAVGQKVLLTLTRITMKIRHGKT